MRKLCTCLVLLALTALAAAPRAGAAFCASYTYKCSCSGAPLKCCILNGQEVCQPTSDIQCTQVYNC